MKITHLALLTALAVAAPNAFAQAPATAPGSTTTTTTTVGTTDSGAISNNDSSASTVGIAPNSEVVATNDMAMATETGEFPNTGGAPLLMALAGFALASGGLLLRRKIA